MDLLFAPVALFNEDMTVEAYYFRHRKGNDIIEATRGTGVLDGAMLSAPLELLNKIGLEAFTMGKPIVVPIDNFMLLTCLEFQCQAPPEKVIFLVDHRVKMEEPYIANMKRLKAMGYRFGIQKLDEWEPYRLVLAQCDFIFYDYRRFDEQEQNLLRAEVGKVYPHLQTVYAHIYSMEDFETLKKNTHGLYEGRFYHMPVMKREKQVSPLQANQISLLNMVQDNQFEFSEVSKVIERDTALTINLLQLVNSPYIGLRNKVKSINHAVTMLGQEEVRKWITTAVAKMLGANKPSELTRLSLIRAKFCESLAKNFRLADEAQGLFLMGLFSVLDAVLDMPMDEALNMVHVSDVIRDALVDGAGAYYPVYDFVLQYEEANWPSVSRMLIINDITPEDICTAYTDAFLWYRDLLGEEV